MSKYLIIIHLPKTYTIITITLNPSTYLLGTWTLRVTGFNHKKNTTQEMLASGSTSKEGTFNPELAGNLSLFRVKGVGFRVEGLGFRVLGFKVEGLGF